MSKMILILGLEYEHQENISIVEISRVIKSMPWVIIGSNNRQGNPSYVITSQEPCLISVVHQLNKANAKQLTFPSRYYQPVSELLRRPLYSRSR